MDAGNEPLAPSSYSSLVLNVTTTTLTAGSCINLQSSSTSSSSTSSSLFPTTILIKPTDPVGKGYHYKMNFSNKQRQMSDMPYRHIHSI
ncbi:hypothetical protein Csa_016226 [Cucumis sativus]|uniref:Uncharacterized protein n=1 Tax=Cucumis sativus TaxID=3659 RepID=A0A0A0K748_CUCSA|nr:hypothetical protein Csa_016226 [Cucumis sativus]